MRWRLVGVSEQNDSQHSGAHHATTQDNATPKESTRLDHDREKSREPPEGHTKIHYVILDKSLPPPLEMPASSALRFLLDPVSTDTSTSIGAAIADAN